MRVALGEKLKEYKVGKKHGIDCFQQDNGELVYNPWYRRSEDGESFYYTLRFLGSSYDRINCKSRHIILYQVVC